MLLRMAKQAGMRKEIIPEEGKKILDWEVVLILGIMEMLYHCMIRRFRTLKTWSLWGGRGLRTVRYTKGKSVRCGMNADFDGNAETGVGVNPILTLWHVKTGWVH